MNSPTGVKKINIRIYLRRGGCPKGAALTGTDRAIGPGVHPDPTPLPDAYNRMSHPMLILHVHIHVKPEHLEEFKQATMINASNSVKEPGIARFDVIQQEDDPTRFVLVEVYRDLEAAVKHKETAHYLAWAEKATDWLVQPRSRVRYTNVFPADQGW
jgi:quinol monooxygenase YgiN